MEDPPTSTRPSLKILDDRYELSNPIPCAEDASFRLLSRPITVQTYANFLNELGHVEKSKGPTLINIVNYDQSLHWISGTWHARPGRDRLPMTLVTFTGARLLAEWAGMNLMSRRQWESVLEWDRPFLSGLTSTELNIEDTTGGPVSVDCSPTGPSGVYGLLGNVGFWGEHAGAGFAWSFGIGWNKSRLHVESIATRRRWIYSTSVSTGIRFVQLSN